MSTDYFVSIQYSTCVTTAHEKYRVQKWLKNKSGESKNYKTWHNAYQTKCQAKAQWL